MAKATVSGSPDPLPHGATGTVSYQTGDPAPWCYVGLIVTRPDGTQDETSVQFLDLFRGHTTYSFGPTPTWDGTSGGQIKFRLFKMVNGVQRTLATATGTYL